MPLPTFSTDRRNAKRAADTAISTKTPHSVLIKANKTWKKFNGDKPFGGTYMSSTPEMWADQNIGLAIQSHLATHIKKSLTKIQYIKGNRETSDANPSRNIFDDEETEAAWRTYNGPLDHDDDLMDGFNNIMFSDDVLDTEGELPRNSGTTPRTQATSGD